MAGIKITPFRLGADTLADLNALAANNGGNNTLALKEAVAQFRSLVEAAGRDNAEELSREDWHRLAHLNDPGDPLADLDLDDGASRHGVDWSLLLAQELIGMWEGREVVLPAHKSEQKECAKLAKRIAGWGPLRGYALMSALRYFWREPSAGIEACAAPEVWLTPTAPRVGTR